MAESYAKSGGGVLSLRAWTFPEEDRPQFTTAPWQGGYRWFRSANVIDLWRYRNSVEKARICAVLLRKAQAKHTTPTHAPPELGP
jgi:hypothetical protein